MATNSEVLQEFLVSLKFLVDESSMKKFLDKLKLTETASFRVAKGVLGVAAAAQAMVLGVSYEFERLYYMTKRFGDTAKNIQGAIFGGKQIGINAETMESALAGMAQQMRTNPGMTALFKALTGKEPSGTVASMIELVKQLQKMPYFVAAQWAQKFGISEDMFNMLMQPGAIDKMMAADQYRKNVNDRLGLDPDKLAEQSKQYMDSTRELTANLTTLASLVGFTLIPAFKGLNTAVENLIQWMTNSKTKNPVQRDAKGNPLPAISPTVDNAALLTKPTYMESVVQRTFDLINEDWRNKVGKKPGSGSGGMAAPSMPSESQPVTQTEQFLGFRRTMREIHVENIESLEQELRRPQLTPRQRQILTEELNNEKQAITINSVNTVNITTSDDPQAVGAAARQGSSDGLAIAIRNAQPVLNTGGATAR